MCECENNAPNQSSEVWYAGAHAADDLHQMIADENDAMRDLGFEIKLFKYPVDNQTYVAFINKVRRMRQGAAPSSIAHLTDD